MIPIDNFYRFHICYVLLKMTKKKTRHSTAEILIFMTMQQYTFPVISSQLHGSEAEGPKRMPIRVCLGPSAQKFLLIIPRVLLALFEIAEI